MLKEYEAGIPAQEVIRKHGIASGTFYRWKSKFGGMEVSEAKRLRENGRFRDGCLNQHWFQSLADARRIINDWRKHYNNVRPHSSLGYQAPAVFEAQAA